MLILIKNRYIIQKIHLILKVVQKEYKLKINKKTFLNYLKEYKNKNINIVVQCNEKKKKMNLYKYNLLKIKYKQFMIIELNMEKELNKIKK